MPARPNARRGGFRAVTSVRAVVIGVEVYAAGDSWALDGPAADVVRVVTWLRDSGVPADQITVLVSALPHNRGAVEALGAAVRPPTRAQIYDLFTREIPAGAGDELFVHWSGRGLLDEGGARRLFCADASAADKRNVDFDALRAFLATTAVPAFRRQVLLVDAGQVPAAERRYVGALPADGWPGGSYRPDREQHSLFAAATREPAESLFTTDLERHGLSPAGLDVAALAARADRRFTDLRLSGRARQTPAYVWVKTPRAEGLVYDLPRHGGRRMTMAGLRDVVDTMLAADELASTPSRQRMVMTMPVELRAPVDHSGTPREHLIAWLRACERFRTGRSALEGVLDLSMSDREAFERVIAAFDRNWPAG